ncbi:MAG: hypothetical protein KJ646_05395 [Nanoarchaeota archaeon]|nr:hypothetical protein [Nanoarchaeota archaeon]
MERDYYNEHSCGRGLRKIVLKVFTKREIRNIDSCVPYCDIFVNGKQKGTIRVNKKGNNNQKYNVRDLISKARGFYVGNIFEKHYNLDVIIHETQKFYRGLSWG